MLGNGQDDFPIVGNRMLGAVVHVSGKDEVLPCDYICGILTKDLEAKWFCGRLELKRNPKLGCQWGSCPGTKRSRGILR
ncbi:MAG: hypothetical protein ACREBC_34080, partial [Pyrinomonadaceae bacterium]